MSDRRLRIFNPLPSRPGEPVETTSAQLALCHKVAYGHDKTTGESLVILYLVGGEALALPEADAVKLAMTIGEVVLEGRKVRRQKGELP